MRVPSREELEAVDEKASVEESIVRGVMAHVPPSWTLIEKLPGGGGFMRGGIQVLFTVQRYEDGRIWVHASACGRRGKDSYYLPTWDDMKRVKTDFIGADRWAYQVFPDERNYVNQHPYVLHLFALLEGEPALPDFTWGLGTI